MNLSQLIANSAPTLGSAVAGKAGELMGIIAKNVISSVFSLPENSDEDNIYNAIKNNPEALLKLKDAEIAFQQKLVDAEIEFEKISASDRDSARKMQIATNSKFPELLAIFIIGFTCFICFYILKNGVPKNVSEMVAGSILQLFMSLSVSIIGYFFGSSIGSKIKTENISQAISTSARQKL
jgi:hypothetical protein